MTVRDRFLIVVMPALLAVGFLNTLVLGQQGHAPQGQSHQPDAKRASLSQHIHEVLAKKYDLGLPDDASLETFLKSIKKSTANLEKNDPGIPIYVSPEGLEYVGMTLESHVILDPAAKNLGDCSSGPSCAPSSGTRSATVFLPSTRGWGSSKPGCSASRRSSIGS